MPDRLQLVPSTVDRSTAGSKIILRGAERILALTSTLREFAMTTGQPGALDDLNHFLSLPASLRKEPVLVVTQTAPGELSLRSLRDATLVFEYQVFNQGLRVYTSADTTGRRTVLAPTRQRATAATAVAATLLAQGAHVVHLAFQPDEEFHSEPEMHEVIRKHLPSRVDYALTLSSIPLFLPLGPTLDETMARIGQRTRSNLRYYRRRTEREVGCVYLAEVHTTLPEFLAFNRACTYAVPDELATWRFNSLQSLADPLFVGIADRDGHWLSLAGGRRRGTEVEIDWQMNRDDLPHLSLSTVLRACLIEAEVARGSKRLYIEGGTPNPIGLSFTRTTVAELTVKRRSLYLGALARFAPRLIPSKNYIGQLLTDPALEWQSL